MAWATILSASLISPLCLSFLICELGMIAFRGLLYTTKADPRPAFQTTFTPAGGRFQQEQELVMSSTAPHKPLCCAVSALSEEQVAP